MIHQISGRIHATFSRTRITKINEHVWFSRRLTSKFKVTDLVCVTFHISGWLGSCYLRDLGVYFHMFEVKGHNYDIRNSAVLSGDLLTQATFRDLSYLCVSICPIGEISVSISTYSRSRVTIMI